MRRKSTHIRVDPNNSNELIKWTRKLSDIEDRNVSVSDIIDRMMKGEETLDKLKRGSIERKMRKR